MRIETFGALAIGSVLLSVGLVVLGTEIDRNVLCFKQCNLQKSLSTLLGQGVVRLVSGLFFSVVGLLFIVPVLRKRRNDKLS